MSALAEAPKLRAPERPINYALENYLLSQTVVNDFINPDGLFAFGQLPDGIISGQVHAQALLLSNLTQEKAFNQKEYGAWIHFDLKNRQLLYPEKPTPGSEFFEDGKFHYAVTPLLVKNDEIFPIAFAHSHPRPNDFFSYQDLGLMMNVLKETAPAISIVSTPEGENYLMLLTKESEKPSLNALNSAIIETSTSLVDEANDYATSFFRGIKSTRAAEALMSYFADGPARYYQEMLTVVTLAEKFKIGIYRAGKNENHYYRLNHDSAIKWLNFSARQIRNLV